VRGFLDWLNCQIERSRESSKDSPGIEVIVVSRFALDTWLGVLDCAATELLEGRETGDALERRLSEAPKAKAAVTRSKPVLSIVK
jgi:hypothetical protein